MTSLKSLNQPDLCQCLLKKEQQKKSEKGVYFANLVSFCLVGCFFKQPKHISMFNLTFQVDTSEMDDTLLKQPLSPLQLWHKPHTLVLATKL